MSRAWLSVRLEITSRHVLVSQQEAIYLSACMLAKLEPTFFSLKFSLDAMLPTGSGAIVGNFSNKNPSRFYDQIFLRRNALLLRNPAACSFQLSQGAQSRCCATQRQASYFRTKAFCRALSCRTCDRFSCDGQTRAHARIASYQPVDHAQEPGIKQTDQRNPGALCFASFQNLSNTCRPTPQLGRIVITLGFQTGAHLDSSWM